VELDPEVADPLGVLRDLLLLPGVVDRLEQRDEVRGAREDHAAPESVLQQLRVPRNGGGEERLPGNEHHDELRRDLELVGVRLPREARDVIAHELRVLGQASLALGVVHRLLGLEERAQGELRVHDETLSAREVHDHVGPLRADVAEERRLLQEVAVRDHAGQLDDALEVDLPPASARDRPPKRLGQSGRLEAQPFGLLADLGVGGRARGLERGQLVLEVLELRGDRLHLVEERRAVGVERLA